MFNLRGWLRQPTTIHGLGGLLATLGVLLPGYVEGAVTPWAVLGGIVFSAVLIVLPDNTAAAKDVQTLTVDVLRGALAHAVNVQMLVKDMAAVADDIAVKPAAKSDEPAQPTPMTGVSGIGQIASSIMVAMIGASLLVLSACGLTPDQQAQLQVTIRQDAGVACMIDGVVQPIAAPVLAALVPTAAGAVGIDTLAIHPAVAAFCASLGGTPAALPPLAGRFAAPLVAPQPPPGPAPFGVLAPAPAQ